MLYWTLYVTMRERCAVTLKPHFIKHFERVCNGSLTMHFQTYFESYVTEHTKSLMGTECFINELL